MIFRFVARLRHSDLTEQTIAAAYRVHDELGGGFLEKVYENAMALELRDRGIRFRAPLRVHYRGHVVGEYFAYLLVEDVAICELEALEGLPREAEVQLVHCLVATGIDVGLLINFGRSVTVRRKFRQFENPVNPV
jgi:GxxExxY protein